VASRGLGPTELAKRIARQGGIKKRSVKLNRVTKRSMQKEVARVKAKKKK